MTSPASLGAGAMIAMSVMLSHVGTAQVHSLNSYSLGDSSATPLSLPPSNSVSHIAIQDSVLWIGTGKGLARSLNAGQTWQSFRANSAFANDGIFAITVQDSLLWASTGFVRDVGGSGVQTGSGYAFSTDRGTSWTPVGQTLDARGDSVIVYGLDSLRILPIVVPEQNVTFDISLSPGKIWIASWASGLRYSTDNGGSWQRVILPPDNRDRISPRTPSGGDTLTFYVDPRQNNNFLAFSVLAIDNDTIWCGTAGGVNKSTDGGVSWTRFTRNNQASPVLGNWVIAMREQRFQSTKRIWITNWRAEDPNEEFGVSYTEDGGRTWRNLLHGIRAYDFAFKDSIAYIATDEGLYRTDDGGGSFVRNGTIVDTATRQIITKSAVFAVGVTGDTIWAGTDDGLVSTLDNPANPFGSTWKIYRTYERASGSQTYAYPNPFSPNFEVTRIHYQVATLLGAPAVSIDVFDFGMNPVRSIIRNAVRLPNGGPALTPSQEYDEIWDGRDEEGKIVPNGTYFYRVKVVEEIRWGKILVLR